jgi:hypothetical protein
VIERGKLKTSGEKKEEAPRRRPGSVVRERKQQQREKSVRESV